MTINREKFDIALANTGLTIAELSERAGMSRQRLSVILNQKSVTPRSAGRVSRALGVDVTEIIDD